MDIKHTSKPETKEVKEVKEIKEIRKIKEIREVKEIKEIKESTETTENKESKVTHTNQPLCHRTKSNQKARTIAKFFAGFFQKARGFGRSPRERGGRAPDRSL